MRQLRFFVDCFQVVIGILSIAVLAPPAYGENIEFPPDAGVINVRLPPYNAKGDGITDDTEALQQALAENGNAHRIIYLPNGTYIVSDTLRWPGATNAEARYRATILQGQSRNGTIIQLADYAAGFQNAGVARPVIWTGERGFLRWRNAVRNLTIDTGNHNPAAIGLRFFSQKQGCVREVTIRAHDEDGPTGIDLSYSDEVGPALLKSVRIEGFEVGLRAAFAVNSLTCEHLEFDGQRQAAIQSSGQTMSLRDIRSTNSCTAIQNLAPAGTGYMVLVDAFLGLRPSRRPPAAAIYNKGLFFARNLHTPAYSKSVENLASKDADATGPDVPQFNSHRPFSLFESPLQTLNLPVEETPQAPEESLENWVSPLAHGGLPGDTTDDAAAIQKAIDSGKTTLYLPNGVWTIRTPVLVRGNIHRIIGCEARLRLDLPAGQAALTVTNGSSSSLFIERIAVETSGSPLLANPTDRRLIVSSCAGFRATFGGTGDVYLEDVHVAQRLDFGKQRVWARQVWADMDGDKFRVKGGTFWGLGIGSERPGTLLATEGGGRSEILGGLVIASGPWKDMPLLRLVDSNGSFVLAETSFNRAPFQVLVSEKRRNLSKVLTNRGIPAQELPFHAGGRALPLYVGNAK